MARFEIPEPLIPGFTSILELDDNQFNNLIIDINQFPAGASKNSFEEKIKGNIDTKDYAILAETIFSFGSLLFNNNSDPVDSLAEEIAKIYSEKIDLTEDKLNKLINRLQNIFNSAGQFKITFKAINLLLDNDNIYRNSRILTDLRFVFDNDIADKSNCAVVIHRLKIEYQSNEDNKFFYFSLDNKDLLDLKEQIDRAVKKEKSIMENHSSIDFINIRD